LTALFQSEHLALLIGSGLTHAVHYMATGASAPGMSPVEFSVFNEEISNEAKRFATAAGRQEGNIEDQIRAANELLRGLEIITATKAPNTRSRKKVKALQEAIKKVALLNFKWVAGHEG